jgi:hypothetical protein
MFEVIFGRIDESHLAEISYLRIIFAQNMDKSSSHDEWWPFAPRKVQDLDYAEDGSWTTEIIKKGWPDRP